MAPTTPVKPSQNDEKMSLTPPILTCIPDTPPPEYEEVISEVRNQYNNENGPLDSAAVAESLLEKAGVCLPSYASDVGSGSDITPPDDPWAPQAILLNREESPLEWSELAPSGKCRMVARVTSKLLSLVTLLYLFICSLGFLASSFRLLGGKTAGNVTSDSNLVTNPIAGLIIGVLATVLVQSSSNVMSDSNLITNPIAGLMIGVLATVLVQSSSTSTSIVVTMVASGLITVPIAIPMVMGANIGTSVTNTIVSLAQSANRNEFRRAFGGATVHDMFNWLTVIVLLPLECATGYLHKLTHLIVTSYKLDTSQSTKREFLKVITRPFTNLVIMLDKNVIKKIATGHQEYVNHSLIKVWCKFADPEDGNTTLSLDNNSTLLDAGNESLPTKKIGVEKCYSLFSHLPLSDTIAGTILLVISITMLCTCLICMVKLLHSMLRGSIAKTIHRFVNADFPGCWSFLTGYVAIIVAAGMTILVQSSSIFTSALTPLVGIGVLRIERMYPLCLGSNIGTTFTSILAALAADGEKLSFALQIALCHLFFNISGILIYYPIPAMRKIPIGFAKTLGNTTAQYRWFAILYLISMFFFLPGLVFGLSLAGTIPFAVIGGAIFVTTLFIAVVNILQRKRPSVLPNVLQNWSFLPKCLRSFQPLDRVFQRVIDIFPCCSKCRNPPPTNQSSLASSYMAVDMSSLDVSPLSSRSTSGLLITKTRL